MDSICRGDVKEGNLSGLYVLDVERFAMLLQFEPPVDLRVEALEEERARRILEEKPDLGLDLDTLRAMVHLRLYQSYEFEIRDMGAVWSATLQESMASKDPPAAVDV